MNFYSTFLNFYTNTDGNTEILDTQ